MAFSSNFFLFAFLPVVLAIYFASPMALRNGVLLAASLAFYAFDAGWTIWVLLASIIVNYLAALQIARLEGTQRYAVFAVAAAANLALLLHYKYTGFLWDAASRTLAAFDLHLPALAPIQLPIGISFFTFQALSYIADVHAGVVKPAARLVDFGMYHSLFPQLIAGPIVRFVEVERAVYQRFTTLDAMAEGGCRFCIGLGKKLIIADTMGMIADPIFKLSSGQISLYAAWLGLVAYTLQIYFDFSGYSDMAIGLGRMFGFNFPENFNQPYRSRSITEFWRRWHMTLSRWFRDYLYIPLGGNRCGPWRTYRNLVVVFFLCGLWHGAGYTFVIWGLYHGALLVVERLYRTYWGELPRGFFAWATTLLLVMIGWVIFRAPTLAHAIAYLSALFGLGGNESGYVLTSSLGPEQMIALAVGLFCSLVPFESASWRLSGSSPAIAGKAVFALAVLSYAIALLAVRSFNPFIYFRF
jgi:alginate O-acetyltransferase complex protein AlgI